MSIEKFAVKYKTSTKLVYVQNHADIYSEIKKVYQSTIPDNFNLKYEDKEFGLVDLDSLIQLHDRKNNILHVEEPIIALLTMPIFFSGWRHSISTSCQNF